MPFDRIFLDELSARNDIVEIVSQYVQLKKSGANYFGLCPFHNEKTGSFSVSPDKQIFHCFGCGAGGGVITFIMKAEGLTFPDAVRYLAERAGMQIPEQGEAERKAARHRERLYALCRDAGRYYYDTLWRPENRNRTAVFYQPRSVPKDDEPFRTRLCTGFLPRAHRCDDGQRLHARGTHGRRSGQPQRKGTYLRPVPQPCHVP